MMDLVFLHFGDCINELTVLFIAVRDPGLSSPRYFVVWEPSGAEAMADGRMRIAAAATDKTSTSNANDE